MGQQQLLLLVLGIVIVGIAVVAGIQLFDRNKSESQADAAHGRSVELAAEVAIWKRKPFIYGGGNTASGIDGVTVEKLGYAVTGDIDGYPATGDSTPWLYAIRDTNTASPFVDVAYYEGTELMLEVKLYIYGPEQECWKPQTGRLQNGTMVWGDAPTAPAGCRW